MSEYWLSLEKKGALAIQPIDIAHLPIFHVDDYIVKGATDHTIGIQAATAALAAHGKGVLSFGKKAYTLFTSSTVQTFAINVSNLTNVAILGNGCTITSGRAADQATADLNFIYAGPVTGLYVEGFKFVGSNSGTSSSTGEKFLRYGAGCKNITVVNCDVRSCHGGVECDDNTAKNRGITVLDCYFEKCFYPLEVTTTDDVFARYTSINGGRCYFPQSSNGISCDNHDISVTSQSGYTSSDCLLQIIAKNGSSNNVLSNIRLNYHSPGRTAGAGNATDALVDFFVQQASASTAAGHFRNITINVAANGLNSGGSASDWQPHIFRIRKLKSNGDSDDVGRGHTFYNVTIGGTAINWDDAEGGIKLFETSVVGAGSAQNWSGDFAACLAVRDFVVNGNPVNDTIYVNGQAAVTGKPFLDIENVSILDGTYTEANCSTANIAHRNVAASNLSAADRRPVSYTPTGNGITFANATGMTWKDGRKVTAMFDVTWPNTADVGEARIGGLTFTVANQGVAQQGFISYIDVGAGTDYTLAAIANTTYGRLFDTAGGTITNATMSQKRLIGTLVYFV